MQMSHFAMLKKYSWKLSTGYANFIIIDDSGLPLPTGEAEKHIDQGDESNRVESSNRKYASRILSST